MEPILDYRARSGLRRFLRARQWRWLVATGIALIVILIAGYCTLQIVISLPRDKWEVDLNSGRLRHTQYFLWFKSNETVSETVISTELAHSDIKLDQPDWHPTASVTFGGTRADYAYGAAIGEMTGMGEIWKAVAFDDGAKLQVAFNVLRCWHRDRDCEGSERYLQKIGSFALGPMPSPAPISAKQLPADGPK
jgi:hypothetical protein